MKKLFFTAILLATSSVVYASPQFAIMTQCRLNSVKLESTKLAENKNYALIQTTDEELTKVRLKADERKDKCGYYVNVTGEWTTRTATQTAESLLDQFTKPQQKLSEEAPIPKLPKYAKYVQSALSGIDANRMYADLSYISDPVNFTDRSAYTDHGLKMANWIKTTVEDFAAQNPDKSVSVQLLDTGLMYKQPSVVIKIGESKEPAVVIGAHMDTLGTKEPPFDGYKPGADDDGSGTVTVLELTRALLQSVITFNRPIYVVWYAAEERGLVGSKVVAKYFKNEKIPVHAVLQLDMTGYVIPGEGQKLWIMDDYSNADLNNFVWQLGKTYAGADVIGHTSCGYACSDHASWTNLGVRAAMPAETKFEDSNPYIHTAKDTIDRLSLDQMTKFLKLAVAFAVELGEPSA